MEKIDRVFFHELGHFVANELNKRYYYGAGTEEIKLFHCPTCPLVWCGHARPKLPLGHDPNASTPIERIAIFASRILYGCVFQSYFQTTLFKECLSIHGEEDSRQFLCGLLVLNLDKFYHPIIQIVDEYSTELKKEMLLDGFMKLDIEKYLISNIYGNYFVDIDNLLNDCNAMIEVHYSHYCQLITKINRLIGLI